MTLSNMEGTIRYLEEVHDVAPAQLEGFFVGWPDRPSPETLLRLLRESGHRIIAMDEDGKVVGFVTAITDGVLAAYIPFLEVLPEHQGRGIGSELMGRITEKLGNLYMVDLLCDPEAQPFYEKLGMRKAVGMMIRNRTFQGGNRQRH